MSPQLRRSLRQLEGHHVRVRFGDGSRLDCELVSSARRGTATVWLHDQRGTDLFVPVSDIVELRAIA